MPPNRDDARRRVLRGVAPVAAALGIVALVSVGGWLLTERPWEPPVRPAAEHLAWVPIWMPDAPAEQPDGLVAIPVPEAEWAAIAGDVRAADPGADVRVIAHTAFEARDGRLTLLEAVDGPLPEGALTSGRDPGHGEVVLAEDLALELGAGIGDLLALAAPDEGPAPFEALTVVGLSRADDGGDEVAPRGYAAWDDAPALVAAYSPVQADASAVTDGYLRWDGAVPAAVERYLVANP
ncbi:hypothetical protein [Demequina sp.]|uniref:hypothetical protein n=1 Tax=Demequina sp. TaxID=2050685 RepID=UPI0025F0798D|nr:hypothetical protein [Demequina sp.]